MYWLKGKIIIQIREKYSLHVDNIIDQKDIKRAESPLMRAVDNKSSIPFEY